MKKSMILLGMLSIGYAYAQEDRVGINTESPAATLNVKTKNDTKSPKSLELENQAGTKLMTVLNNGNVGVGTDTPAEKLSVLGGRIAVSGDGTITGYLEDVHLKFNRPYDAYVSNLNEKGRLAIQTGGHNIRMTFWENGRISAGTTASPTFFTIKGISNYGIMRLVSNNSEQESTIGYQIDKNDPTITWVTGVNPKLGDGNSFMISKGGSPRIFVKDRNVGIGTITPENRLHVSSDSNPLRLEGLQEDITAQKVLVADATGVVKTIDKSALTGGNSTATAVKLPTTNSATCGVTTIGTINFGEITINGNKTTAFGFCMKNSANQYVWGYMFAGGNFTTGNATFGGGL